MEKNFLKDVIPPAHQKSVRDIPLPNKSREGARPLGSERDPSMRKANTYMPKRTARKIPEGQFARKKSKVPFIIGAIVLILGGGWLYGVFAHSATIELATEPITSGSVNNTFTIYNKTNPPETVPQSYIPYTIQTITAEASQEVAASGREEVEEFATGKITVYKKTAGSQPLIKNTRFQTEDGRIYRVRDSITIPGNGSKEIVVYADEPGESFNVASATFTVPGLKELPEFDEIYAETTTPITGGFSGVRNVVSEADEEKTRGSLQEKLEQDLVAKINDTISFDEKIFYYTPSFITYTSAPSDASGDNVIVKETGSLQGLLFDRSAINSAIVSSAVSGVTNLDAISVDNMDVLSISLEDKEDFDPETNQTGNLSISGNPEYSWGITQKTLAEGLKGLSKDEASSILLDLPGVQKFVIKTSPFWKNSIPDDPEAISVTFQD